MVQTCFRHSRRETNLRCGRCGRPICSECVTHSDVGIRCPVCVKESRPAGLDVSPAHFLLASMAALGVGAAGGAVNGFLLRYVGWIPFLSIAVFLLVGFLVGESIARLIGVRHSTGLQVVAGLGVVVAYVVTNIIKSQALISIDPFTIVIAVIAVAVAASRVR